MTANATTSSAPYPYPVLRWVGTGAIALLAAGFVYVLIASVIRGPAARAAADREEAIVIEKESRLICTGLGLVVGSELYARCTEGLAQVRRRQKERLTSDLDML